LRANNPLKEVRRQESFIWAEDIENIEIKELLTEILGYAPKIKIKKNVVKIRIDKDKDYSKLKPYTLCKNRKRRTCHFIS
jgi:hypothetical protein